MKLILSLEREGGHILVLTILVVTCLLLSLTFPDNNFIGKAGEMTLGALLFAMKGNGNVRENANAKFSSNLNPPAEAKPQ